VRSLARELALLPSELEKAQVRALNRTVRVQRNHESRVIRSKLALRAAPIKRDFPRVRRANRADLTASFGVVRRGRPLYRGRPVYLGTRQTRRGLSVRDRKDQPRYLLEGAFISKNKRLSLERVYRNGKRVGRLPVDLVYGESPYEVFGEISDAATTRAGEYYQARLLHEMDWILSRPPR